MAGNPLASLPGLPQRPSLARSSASETRLTQPGIEAARSRKLNSAPTAAFRLKDARGRVDDTGKTRSGLRIVGAHQRELDIPARQRGIDVGENAGPGGVDFCHPPEAQNDAERAARTLLVDDPRQPLRAAEEQRAVQFDDEDRAALGLQNSDFARVA